MKLTSQHPLAWIDDELDALDQRKLLRGLTTHAGAQRVRLRLDGQELVSFGSNDYLALAADPRVVAAAVKATQLEGWGAGASPLVTGHGQSHELLERRLADFEHTEAALLFTSGYAANLGTLAALVGPGDVVYSDAKNHASIIDGCRLSRATVRVYKHRDVDDLEAALRDDCGDHCRLIASEAVFSMDGDLAPLADLADLAERYQCMLLVDEAHGTGVFGEQGRGLGEHLGVSQRVDIRVGTLSKALGSAGGFVCGSRSLVSWLANRARSYVFSTATPAALAAAALTSLDIVRDEPERRTALLQVASNLRERLRSNGWNVGDSESQIVPIMVGDAERALNLAARLRDRGLLVPAIRPLSVPTGESLLRVSLTSGHSVEMVDQLATALGQAR
jgi:8-amino-7-oxononanoate synthase